MSQLTESVVEDATLAWLEQLGYAVLYGPEIAVGEDAAERSDPSFRDVVLGGRLGQALSRLNPDLPPEALEDAYRKLTRIDAPSLVERNRALHRMLVDGVTVEYRRRDGSIAGAQALAIDFEAPERNDWLAVNQFSVAEGERLRRADVVLFVNGLPLAVIELKNPADENATVSSAYQQLQTYQAEIPALFTYTAALVASDGVQARIGSLGAGSEWFKPWRTISGRADADSHLTELQVVLEGVFEKRRFLDLIRHFIVFEDFGPGGLVKKMAGYHQFHAVNAAVEETLRASVAILEDRGAEGHLSAAERPGGAPGDRRVGVVWHTQGSGKSLTMAFYAGRIILEPAMANPTVVVITDRNDLDDQLFGTFCRCQDLLRQPPTQAADRADLREKLSVASGGVVFTTIQKFFPEEKGDRHPVLSERRNIVVIADEAHRSQYDFIDGFARHMRDALPNASFIGFTGTPDRADRQEHPLGLRRLHQRLRHPARRRRRRHRPDLLREPPGQARPGRGREAEDRSRLRGGHRGRGGRGQGKAQEHVGAARSRSRHREAPEGRCKGHRHALRGAARGDGGEGDDRLHEPAHLRRSLCADRRPPARVGRRRRQLRLDQGRHDRLRLGSARVAEAHP